MSTVLGGYGRIGRGTAVPGETSAQAVPERRTGRRCGAVPRHPRPSRAATIGVARALVIGFVFAGGTRSAGQTDGSIPRLPNGRPDFNGIWAHPYVPDMTQDRRDQQGAGDLPFTLQGSANFQAYDPADGDYTGSCMPFGFMRSVNSPYPIQLVQNGDYLTFLFEQNTWFHVVPTGGREHPADPNPTWFGDSVGRWNGDTLVIDTVAFNGFTRLDTIGHPHSDALHLVQTLRLVDADTLAYTVTVEDRKLYTRSWTNERTFRRTDDHLIEYSCEENNRSLWEGRLTPWIPPTAR